MRTSFLDCEDKQLVQIALEFEREGIRVTWAYVARRMAKSKRTATEPRLRLPSLKRTHGKAVKNFPRCFSGGSAAFAVICRCAMEAGVVRQSSGVAECGAVRLCRGAC
ncbi:hypothetical protein PC116_g18071 [Phytophthora cactorum]|nr:hypothetical protein PC128_g15688 [Phytophthora cactorum]KAG4233738.1 hypothetical protein PC116_g18071 [Phytophthora cactorum]